VPEDRFGDLGEPDQRSAAEKLAELDERDPEPDHPSRRPPEAARPSGRYMWVVGVAALILLIVVAAHQLSSSEGTFIKGPAVGRPLPEFAAPLVLSDVEGDSNIKPRSSTEKRKPLPACDVHLAGTLNICDQWNKPVVVSFLFIRGAHCEPQFDRLQAMHREFPQVNIVGVFFEPNRGKARDTVRKHGWTFPIVADRDGVIPNLYAVGGCPTTVFAKRGGTVRKTVTHEMSPSELRAEIRATLR
jgi:peroxiredoxin